MANILGGRQHQSQYHRQQVALIDDLLDKLAGRSDATMGVNGEATP